MKLFFDQKNSSAHCKNPAFHFILFLSESGMIMGNQRGLGLYLIFINIILFETYTCLGVGNTSVICSEQERLALLKFKHSVTDELGMLSSWVGNDCCRWERIQCDNVTGNVEGLRLRAGEAYDKRSYLVGDEVSSSLGELRHLKYLDLSGNAFRVSRIPEFIGSFKQLRYLNLSFARFYGIVPNHTGNLSSLKVLDLSSNIGLSAVDMAWTFGLSSLEHIDLSWSNLSRTKDWDMVFYMIPSLKEVRLSNCKLSNANHSPFLNSSRILPNIRRLDLAFNYFIGPLPSFFQNMTSLAFLDLSTYNISSAWNLAHLLNLAPSLSVLHLSNCDLDKMFLSSPHHNLSTLSNIQHLDLSYNSIEGIFPSVLANMSFLTFLDLARNSLTGPIPESLARLRFLQVLHLSHNELNGSIPESFGKLTDLTDLNLGSNRLTGPIPTCLGRLGSLREILVWSNLLNGTIPVSIGQLAKLRSLDISNNSLGVLSEAHFANLSALKDLYTSSNTKLTINVSREWVPPFQLESLGMSSCIIGNGFPRWLQNQRKLEMLVLSNTTISGPLPTWLRRMNTISFLDLSHNKLNGPLTNLPNGGNSTSFPSLFLENNLFNGSIPQSLCKWTQLRFLDLSRNRLSGKIPKCLENLHVLDSMIFSSNLLSGVIPSFIALLSLNRLNLNDNNFIGEVPREFGNSSLLNVLDLGDNKLSGSIEWIGEVPRLSLMVLRLHRNNFTGRIPHSLCKASNLRILDVAHNNLIGTIPRCLGELNAMGEVNPLPLYLNPMGIRWYSASIDNDENVIQVMGGVELEYTTNWNLVYNMDLSSNKLTGEIPVELTALCNLLGLNLSNNHLSGGIPDSIGNLKNLLSLDLSRNELTGMIPQSMAALNFLSHLNLSHNNLSGQIPTGRQLQTLLDPSIYAGNEGLCGPPSSKNCSNHQDPTTSERKSDDEPMEIWLFYVAIMSGFATGFWGIIIVFLFKKQWRMKLFMFVEESMDKIHVAVAIRVAKIKRGRSAI